MAVTENDGLSSILTLFNCKLKRKWESFRMFRAWCLNICGLSLLLFLTACSDSKTESNEKKTDEQANEYAEDQIVVREDGTVVAAANNLPITGVLKSYWPNKQIKRSTALVKGIGHGSVKAWHQNGAVALEGQNVDGRPEGIFKQWSEDQLVMKVTRFQNGKTVSEETHHTKEMESQIAKLVEERNRLDRNVWAPELKAQEVEMTFVRLWDDLRQTDHNWKTLENFVFKAISFPVAGARTSLSHGIIRQMLETSTTELSFGDWKKQIAGWKQSGWVLVETEWHQSEFHPAKNPSDQAKSVYSVVGHLANSGLGRRIILKVKMDVLWGEKGASGLRSPDKLIVKEGKILSRSSDQLFREVQSWNVLQDNPDLPLLKNVSEDKWARVSPTSIVVMDLNGDQLPDVLSAGANLIYWNRGNFKFESKEIIKGANGFPHSLVVAEFTGDQHLDILTVNPAGKPEVIPGDGNEEFKPSNLMSNRDEDLKLENVSCMAVGDVDGDGDNDVFMAQYRPAYEKGTMPVPYFDSNDGHPSWLLINQGDGTFVNGTKEAGLLKKQHRRTYSASFVDLDNDQDLDLMVVSDFAGLDLYTNDGEGHFSDVTSQLGSDRFSFGMGHSVADYNGDGNLDIYMVGMGSTTARRLEGMKLGRKGFESIQDARMKMGYGNRMLLGDGLGKYKQASFNDQVARTGWGWGSTAWDFDNDSDRDLYVANGHLSGESSQDYCTSFWRQDIYMNAKKENMVVSSLFDSCVGDVGKSISWNGFEHNALLLNEGEQGFANASFLFGLSHESDCRSIVAADFDVDGRQDILLVEGVQKKGDQFREGYIQLLRNELKTGNNWIGFNFTQKAVRAAYGAQLIVKQENRNHILPLLTGDSYDAQHPLTVHFGLGKTSKIDEVQIRWVGGAQSKIFAPEPNKYHEIETTLGH